MVVLACALTLASCGGSAALEKGGDGDGSNNTESVDGNGGDGNGGSENGGDNKTANATDWILSNQTFDTNIKVEAVAYGAGKFVVGGTGGSLAYSEDGITWTKVTQWATTKLESSCAVTSIAYVKDKFILGASTGEMASSLDGVTWKAAFPGYPQPISSVAYLESSNQVAVVLDGTLACTDYSSGLMDARWEWSKKEPSITGFLSAAILDTAYGGGKFVAVGTGGKMSYATRISTIASNSFTAVNTNAFGSSRIWGIVYGKDKFVAVGGGGKIAYSNDGIAWYLLDTAVFGDNHNQINRVTYGGGKFVAVGEQGKMVVSADGKEWQAVGKDQMGTSVLLENDIYDVAYGNGKFVVVGDRGKIAVSTN